MDRVALVTGVTRREGIGFAVARRLREDGLRVVVQSWPAPDEAVRGEFPDAIEADFSDAAAPRRLVEEVVERHGALDVLIANHCRDSPHGLETVTAEELDVTWAVNARASVLLVQAYAAAHDDTRPDGRIVLFTSGQHKGPMPTELAYAISKGAIHQMTPTLADTLAPRDITLNAINPGPVDTGYAGAELLEAVAQKFPRGRWGRPEDIAPVIAWLASPESPWITGQVIDAEGGFRRT